jgi:hypothetical protein
MTLMVTLSDIRAALSQTIFELYSRGTHDNAVPLGAADLLHSGLSSDLS